jgi:hypothetical protein
MHFFSANLDFGGILAGRVAFSKQTNLPLRFDFR